MKKAKFVSEYPIKQYRCGLKAGDKICVKKDIVVRDSKGKRTSKLYRTGETWHVLPGAKSKPVVVWLLTMDGERHTWDDNESIFETFVKI
ncbi:hypothetical protein YTPLAS72_30470 [Nitrospira sp.]|nr:hypothetical protein YTPLAS72_30470 [Nitrospira sp.]